MLFLWSFGQRYCSFETGSSHSTFLPPSTGVTAMWVIELVSVAPCQCFTPGGVQMTSPGLIWIFSPPSCCTQPVPDVTISVWPAGWVCQLDRARRELDLTGADVATSFGAKSGVTVAVHR